MLADDRHADLHATIKAVVYCNYKPDTTLELVYNLFIFYEFYIHEHKFPSAIPTVCELCVEFDFYLQTCTVTNNNKKQACQKMILPAVNIL